LKFLICLIISQFSLSVLAKESLTLQFENGTAFFSANISESESGNGFHVKDLSIDVPTASHGSLHLVSEFGWGDQPYHFLCEQISETKYGTDEYKYASGYGYASTFNLLGGLFTNRQYFVVNTDQTFTISDSYTGAGYDSGFSCFDELYEY
jgi:hypothetical protein